jgi:hypothetical protein
MKYSIGTLAFLFLCLVVTPLVQAEPVYVDLELILGTDVSGSIDGTDFTLQRAGYEAAFRNPDIIAAIESGAIGSIAVTLWDFSTKAAVAVPWTVITDEGSSNAFADMIHLALRKADRLNDGQSNLINQALFDLNTNNYDGTRSVLDISSEGAQDIEPCSDKTVHCQAVQDARDAFLAKGGTAINAIWLNDRDYFGLDSTDQINAFEYGLLNVIGGPGSFQTFANDFSQFAPAIRSKLIREINPSAIPEPTSLLLFSTGLSMIGIAAWRRRK